MCSKSDITTNKSDIHTVFVLALIEFTQGGAFFMYKEKLLILLEGALMAAIATVLSAVVTTVEWFDISLGIIPIVIFSIRRGLKAGLLSGLLWGLLPILIGRASILTVTQGILEYPVADMVVGLAGFISNQIKQALITIMWLVLFCRILLAVFISVFAKSICHFIAGIIFWGSYAEKGISPVLSSLFVNGGSYVFNLGLAGIAVVALERKA